MPSGRASEVTIMEGGYSSNVSYMEKVMQHTALEGSLRTYACDPALMVYVCGNHGIILLHKK